MTDHTQYSTTHTTDRFGHPIDHSVGYARGSILASSLDESKRREHAMKLIQSRTKVTGAKRATILGKICPGELS